MEFKGQTESYDNLKKAQFAVVNEKKQSKRTFLHHDANHFIVNL